MQCATSADVFFGAALGTAVAIAAMVNIGFYYAKPKLAMLSNLFRPMVPQTPPTIPRRRPSTSGPSEPKEE